MMHYVLQYKQGVDCIMRKPKKKVEEFTYCVDCFLNEYHEEGYRFKHLEVNDYCFEECKKCGQMRRVVMGIKPNIFKRFYRWLECFTRMHPLLSLPLNLILLPILLPISWHLTKELRAERRKKSKNH